MLLPIVLQLGIGSAVTAGITIVALTAFVGYYAIPIYIAIAITVYELLLRFDIAGTVADVAQAVLSFAASKAKVSGFSVFPAINKSNTGNAEVIKAQSLTIFNMLFQINRGFLYIAFLFCLLQLFPFNTFIAIPSVIFIGVFNMIDTVVTVYEPLILGPIIALALIDLFTDVLVDIAKIAR